MGDEFDAGKYGAIVAIHYSVANAVTNKTNEDLTRPGGNSLAIMPKGGSVVGISAKPSAPLTDGTVTFKAQKEGTEFAEIGAPAPVLNKTAPADTGTYGSIRPGVLTFAAGAGLGVSYTSSTDATPTNTNDYDVDLWVQLDPN